MLPLRCPSYSTKQNGGHDQDMIVICSELFLPPTLFNANLKGTKRKGREK
jgi:hypothetical protein